MRFFIFRPRNWFRCCLSKKNSCYNLNEKLSGLRLMVSKSGAVLSFQVCVQPGPNPQSAPGPFWNRKWFNCGEYFSSRYKICFTFRTSHILFSCVSVQYFLYRMKMRMPLYIQDNLGLYFNRFMWRLNTKSKSQCCQYCRFLIYIGEATVHFASVLPPPEARKNPNLAFY